MKKLHIRKLESLKTTAPGGIPLLHGLSGKDFGAAVSELAKTPGAIAAHVSGGGMPAAHGVDGATFGGLVSGLAKSEPGAVAEHIAAMMGA
ncbi:MAG: hypothetical protein P8X87_06890 [Candidatus Bathyarchaeota archaeon]